MDTLTARVYRFIRENELIQSGDKVIAGVSGGSDSVCLLSVLSELKAVLGIRIWAVHINHRLRGEDADRDQRFTQDLCRRLEIPCQVFAADVAALAREKHWTVEEAGRNFRRRCFLQMLEKEGADRIALAHHLDDQCETVLMNLLRGTGPAGLAGIRPMQGPFIRPLLCVNKEQILECLQRKGLDHCTDATNLETEHTRNRVRNELLPYIRSQINPAADVHIAQAAWLMADAADYLHGQALEAAASILRSGQEQGGAGPLTEIDAGSLLALSPPLRREVLRIAVSRSRGGLKDIGHVHIRALEELASGRTGACLQLPGGLAARKTYDGLILEGCPGRPARRQQDISGQTGSADGDREPGRTGSADEDREPGQIQIGEVRPEEPVCLEMAGQELRLKLIPASPSILSQIPQKIYTKWLDYDKIKGRLCLRCRKSGDQMVIRGGRKKPLRRILIDEKVPALRRDTMALLADGSRVLTVCGLTRISEDVKVTAQTQRILVVEWTDKEKQLPGS